MPQYPQYPQSLPPDLTLQVISAPDLAPGMLTSILGLCRRAYGEDLAHLFDAYTADAHVVALRGDTPVSHAMTVTRWLQAGNGPLLRTAYVELVATAPEFQGRGLATAVMERLGRTIAADGYALGGLCPADTRLYGRLGWEYWQGPLFIRPQEQEPPAAPEPPPAPALIPTPEERVMILRLPHTPPLDLTQPLSAEWRGGGELW